MPPKPQAKDLQKDNVQAQNANPLVLNGYHYNNPHPKKKKERPFQYIKKGCNTTQILLLEKKKCRRIPQVDLMFCKRTDSEVELIANLHIHITNIAFRGLFNTPET
jgi:hypothetical protein